MICSQSSKQIFMLAECFALFLSFQYKCIFLLGDGPTHLFHAMLLRCEAIRRKRKNKQQKSVVFAYLFSPFFFFLSVALQKSNKAFMYKRPWCTTVIHLGQERKKKYLELKSNLEILFCLYFPSLLNFLLCMSYLL